MKTKEDNGVDQPRFKRLLMLTLSQLIVSNKYQLKETSKLVIKAYQDHPNRQTGIDELVESLTPLEERHRKSIEGEKRKSSTSNYSQ